MKKIIIIALVVLTAGSISSCTKENVKPAKSITADKTETGSGDLAGGGSTTGSGDGTSGGN